jgi:hypothetical protein
MRVLDEYEPKEATKLVTSAKCIKQVLEEFLHVMPKKLPENLPPKRQVDHAIEVVPGVAPPAKAPYRMSHEELKELKVQLEELFERLYQTKQITIWGTRLFCSQEGWDVENVC